MRYQFFGAGKCYFAVHQVGFGLVKIGLGHGDFLGARAVLSLQQAGLKVCQVASGLIELSLVLILFKAHQLLAGLHPVAFLHTDPKYPANDLGGYFDLVMRHNISCGIKNHALVRGRSRSEIGGFHSYRINLGDSIQFVVSKSPRTKE